MEHHTYKRHSKKDTASGRKAWINAAAAIASLALIAAIIALSPAGDWINAHIIRPVGERILPDDSDKQIAEALKTQDEQAAKPTSSASPSAAPDNTRVLTVRETPFYLLQMGTFLKRDDAERHASEIRQMGAGGTVMEDGQAFRVMAAAYQDENSLMQVQSQVRGDGFEATPYITDQNSVKITLKGEKAAIDNAEAAIGFLAEVPKELTDMSLLFDRGQIDRTETGEKIRTIDETAKQFADSLKRISNDSLEPVLSVIIKYQESISTFSEICDSISDRDFSSALKGLQIETILHYIRFFDQK